MSGQRIIAYRDTDGNWVPYATAYTDTQEKEALKDIRARHGVIAEVMSDKEFKRVSKEIS